MPLLLSFQTSPLAGAKQEAHHLDCLKTVHWSASNRDFFVRLSDEQIQGHLEGPNYQRCCFFQIAVL